jgi:DNA-binding phage protein
MNKTRYATIEVRSTAEYLGQHGRLQALDAPSRSRLYGLVPCGMETVWCESLTSYINRLGWKHGVAPRALVIQEIAPLLDAERWNAASPQQMSAFCAENAMGLNGLGDLTTAWSTVLEQLTLSSNLHLLTSSWWIGDLASRQRNLRSSPAWCPVCCTEWKMRELPIYQPFLWMLQVVTICPNHKRPLMHHCPQCQAKQAVIVSHTIHAGECTKCAKWLGTEADPSSELTLDDETVNWQQWVIQVLEELRTVNVSAGLIRWETFFTNLATAMKRRGGYSRLARLSGINREVLQRWTAGTSIPSFEMALKFCYVCDTTPLQLMAGQFASLERAIADEVAFHPRQHRRTTHRLLDRERCLEFIQAILDGREPPLGPSQVAKQLGCGASSLRRFFPQECILLTQLAQVHRKQQNEQRTAQICERVREEVKALHAQGISPTHHRVRRIFPSGTMRHPEVNAAWHDALRGLGLKP